MCFQGHCYSLEFAVTTKQKIQGLSNRSHLEPNQGMLFIFDSEIYIPIWMKETTIPLDIIWLDSKFKVVEIKQGQPLDLSILNPGKKARYVLELNQGQSKLMNLSYKDQFKLKTSEQQ